MELYNVKIRLTRPCLFSVRILPGQGAVFFHCIGLV